MEAILMAFLLLAGRGAQPPDLLSLINVDDYFLIHPVENDPTLIAKLVGQQTTTSEEEIDRFLAIRWLGEHHIVAARGTLRRLALGSASDPHDFVSDYAERALAALEPSVHAPFAEPWRDLREELRWFPVDVSLVGAVDLTAPWGRKPFTSKTLAGLMEFALQFAHKAGRSVSRLRTGRLSVQ